jgi:hypothetical protein
VAFFLGAILAKVDFFCMSFLSSNT